MKITDDNSLPIYADNFIYFSAASTSVNHQGRYNVLFLNGIAKNIKIMGNSLRALAKETTDFSGIEQVWDKFKENLILLRRFIHTDIFENNMKFQQ
ncbi:MAG: hypothetical protein NE328_17610 [Lentisphaeraceae bacterium]|nr:hypothetical protein [Lentisphaeraceae bacterium]